MVEQLVRRPDQKPAAPPIPGISPEPVSHDIFVSPQLQNPPRHLKRRIGFRTDRVFGEDRGLLDEMVAHHLIVGEIGALTGFSHNTIRRLLRERGHEIRGQRWRRARTRGEEAMAQSYVRGFDVTTFTAAVRSTTPVHPAIFVPDL